MPNSIWQLGGKVKRSQCFLSEGIINYLHVLYKEVVYSKLPEAFWERQYFFKEGSKAYSSEPSKISVLRKSSHLNIQPKSLQ